ncbi:YrbL family protein [Yoonia sp. R2-816]|uniref:YrbL family protein n=1 Tax=Yoonia sp. R2-816 TaxID=3342638 RepID=UPI003727EF68
MAFDFSDLTLTDADIVAEGGERWIYCSELYPSFVFKKQKPPQSRDLKNNLKGNSMKMFPSLADRIVRKEYKAYVDCCLSANRNLEDIPVSRLYGFAQSSIGIVQVAEKVSLDGESLGPTLASIYRDGRLTEGRLKLLNEFVQLLLDWEMPTNDISAANIVLGMRGGQEKFLAVDGFGDIHVVPVRTYFQKSRKHQLRYRMTKVARSLGIHFDPERFAFGLSDLV